MTALAVAVTATACSSGSGSADTKGAGSGTYTIWDPYRAPPAPHCPKAGVKIKRTAAQNAFADFVDTVAPWRSSAPPAA